MAQLLHMDSPVKRCFWERRYMTVLRKQKCGMAIAWEQLVMIQITLGLFHSQTKKPAWTNLGWSSVSLMAPTKCNLDLAENIISSVWESSWFESARAANFSKKCYILSVFYFFIFLWGLVYFPQWLGMIFPLFWYDLLVVRFVCLLTLAERQLYV